MQTVMRTRIVKLGNSQGIRIPKLVIDQFNLGEEIELLSEDGQLVIRPVARPRANWAAQFAAMARRGDDALLDKIPVVSTDFDDEEWEW